MKYWLGWDHFSWDLDHCKFVFHVHSYIHTLSVIKAILSSQQLWPKWGPGNAFAAEAAFMWKHPPCLSTPPSVLPNCVPHLAQLYTSCSSSLYNLPIYVFSFVFKNTKASIFLCVSEDDLHPQKSTNWDRLRVEGLARGIKDYCVEIIYC